MVHGQPNEDHCAMERACGVRKSDLVLIQAGSVILGKPLSLFGHQFCHLSKEEMGELHDFQCAFDV